MRVVFVEEVLVGPFLLLERVEVFDVGGVPVPAPGAGWEEPAAVWWCVGVDPVSSPVDGDVMVVPAKGGQVGGGVGAAVASGDDVMCLEPVAALAGVDHALAVSCEYGSAEPFGDLALRPPGFCDSAVLEGDRFGAALALDQLYGLGSDSGTVEQLDAPGVAGLVGEGLILDEHDDRLPAGGIAGCEVLIQVVLGHGGEAEGLPLSRREVGSGIRREGHRRDPVGPPVADEREGVPRQGGEPPRG